MLHAVRILAAMVTPRTGLAGASSRRPHLIVAALCAALCGAHASASLAAQEPRVRVAQGELEGASLPSGVRLFAGVPFAAPPVGPLRWKPPAPPPAWSGVRQATAPGAPCPQLSARWNDWEAARSAEDCLTLNVWAPEKGKNLPVMVWIHGGGYVGGSGSRPYYDGDNLVRRGVILVTLNYRLGVLGFLAHPELTAESPNHVSGNYGLEDQAAALAWIHENIARFGGDPANVTLFGQSAGAMSTSTQITMPQSHRFFRRVIVESGTPFSVSSTPPMSDIERANLAFGHIADLRKLPVKNLLEAWDRYAVGEPGRWVMPVVDGHVVKQAPAKAFLTGAVRDVPILVGSNLREIGAASTSQLNASAEQVFGADAAKVLAFYEKQGDDVLLGDPAMQMMTDLQFRCGSIMTARLSDKSWLYHFFEPAPGRSVVAHSSEVPYVFGKPLDATADFSGAQKQLSETMQAYWTNFAKTGDPNGPGLPVWPRYASTGEQYLELKAGGVGVADHLRGEACRAVLARWSER